MNSGLATWAERYEVIVLEGCDGVGKTTLAIDLAESHGYTMVHAARSPDGVDLAERYRTILSRPERLVLDRSFVSELVYGPLRHGHSRLTLAEAADLARIIASRSGVLVHLTGQAGQIAARLTARDGQAPELAEIRTLITGYIRVFDQLTPYAPILTVNTAAAE